MTWTGLSAADLFVIVVALLGLGCLPAQAPAQTPVQAPADNPLVAQQVDVKGYKNKDATINRLIIRDLEGNEIETQPTDLP